MGSIIVSDMLQAAPGLKIVVTSRERLNLRLEQLYPIKGLEFPDWETPEDAAEYTAPRLFIQSARRIRPDFTLQAEDLTYLTRICRLVDGMPLGVELAAAWIDLLTLADIAAEIQQSLDFLETNLHDVPERHRSIRAIFDASWHRLSQAEQEVMAQLSVFRGGFTRTAAQQVAGANLKALATLAGKSLLQANRSRDRYDVHELVRQYAADRLNRADKLHRADKLEGSSVARNGSMTHKADTVGDRHSAYYCEALQRLEAALKGPKQLTALAEIETDIENMRLAWDWAVERGQAERIGQALESLGRFYEWHGRYLEGEGTFRSASDSLSVADDEQRVRIRLLTWRAAFQRIVGKTEQAQQLLTQASTLLDNAEGDGQDVRSERAAVLLGVGNVAADTGDSQEAKRRYGQSVALYQAINDRWSLARVLVDLGRLLRIYGDHSTVDQHFQLLAEAKDLAEQSLIICQELGDRAGIAAGLHNVGVALMLQGHFAEAYTCVEKAMTLYAELGTLSGLVRSKAHLGPINFFMGRDEQARTEADSTLDLAKEAGYRLQLEDVYVTKILILFREEAYGEVRHLAQDAITICHETGEQFFLGVILSYSGYAKWRLGQVSQGWSDLVEALQIGLSLQYELICSFATL